MKEAATEEFFGHGPDGWGRYAFTERPVLLGENDGAAKPLLVRGFVDGHIHGGFGIDVMTASTAEMIRLDGRLRDECGYDGWLPTTVTCARDDALRVLDALPELSSVLGLHLEGPFLSPKHPGAQPPAFLAEYPGPGSPWDDVLDHPRLRIVTLAPEIPGGLELTRRLVARGVVVSLGHTDATAAETDAALDAGASRITHVFNAMRPFHHREVGIVGRILKARRHTAELIYDRLHVSPEGAALIVRNRNVAPISDGTMAIGLEPGTRLTMWGLDCIVGEGDVRLLSGGLAGSAITLREAFANLVEDFGAAEAILKMEHARASLDVPTTFGGWLAFDPATRTLRRLA